SCARFTGLTPLGQRLPGPAGSKGRERRAGQPVMTPAVPMVLFYAAPCFSSNPCLFRPGRLTPPPTATSRRDGRRLDAQPQTRRHFLDLRRRDQDGFGGLVHGLHFLALRNE